MKNKKGISAIVATVLIILITIAAVTIIWAAIIPMISDQLDEATVCMAAEQGLSLKDRGFTCIAATGAVQVQVGLGSDDVKLVGVQVIVSEAGDTTSEDIDANLPGVNEEAVLTTTAVTFASAESVKVAPIIAVGDKDEYCTAGTPVALAPCA